MIVAVIALVCALTGTAWAALGKNSVGSKQLKKNAVVTAKIKKEAVTGGKVKKDTLTGTQINEGTLGAVPLANTVPPNQLHVVGAAGEPGFQSGTINVGSLGEGINLPSAGFLKDHDNVVHLEGIVKKGTGGPIPGTLFQLPPGFRPPSATLDLVTEAEKNTILIAGSNVAISGKDISGLVIVTGSEEVAILTGLSFFAGS
jgi:hypothetical protein